MRRVVQHLPLIDTLLCEMGVILYLVFSTSIWLIGQAGLEGKSNCFKFVFVK